MWELRLLPAYIKPSVPDALMISELSLSSASSPTSPQQDGFSQPAPKRNSLSSTPRPPRLVSRSWSFFCFFRKSRPSRRLRPFPFPLIGYFFWRYSSVLPVFFDQPKESDIVRPLWMRRVPFRSFPSVTFVALVNFAVLPPVYSQPSSLPSDFFLP